MDFHLKLDTCSGQAEIGFSPGTYGQHEKDGPPVKDEAEESLTEGRFIAYDNGTVLDTRTNLMWAAKDNGSSINWADARSYCELSRRRVYGLAHAHSGGAGGVV